MEVANYHHSIGFGIEIGYFCFPKSIILGIKHPETIFGVANECQETLIAEFGDKNVLRHYTIGQLDRPQVRSPALHFKVEKLVV